MERNFGKMRGTRINGKHALRVDGFCALKSSNGNHSYFFIAMLMPVHNRHKVQETAPHGIYVMSAHTPGLALHSPCSAAGTDASCVADAAGLSSASGRPPSGPFCAGSVTLDCARLDAFITQDVAHLPRTDE